MVGRADRGTPSFGNGGGSNSPSLLPYPLRLNPLTSYPPYPLEPLKNFCLL